MRVTLWSNLLDTAGTERELDWDALKRMLFDRTKFLGDREHPGWSPATFRGQRRARDGVERVCALCLDYDGSESVDAATGLWGAFTGLLHTTRKHTAAAPRFRVVLPLARPVSAFEFDALWSRVNAHAGGKLDRQARDPSRFWFRPGSTTGEFECLAWDGAEFDPDEWLSKPDPEARPAVAPRIESDLDRHAHRVKRALAYVSRMDPAIDGQAGHKATWAVACALVKGFSLGERDALAILTNDYNPRCQPPWSAKELEHKIRQASKAKLPDGYLLGDEEERGRRTPSRREPEIPPEPDAAEDFDQPGEGQKPEREPGDDTEAIEKERNQPVGAAERYSVVSLRGMYRAVVEDLQSGKETGGFRCGIDEIDEALGGFRLGNVTLFAAGTSFGKSSFAILLARQNLTDVARPLIVSVEDKLLLYSRRLAATECNINALQLRDRDVKGEAFKRLVSRANEVPDLPVFIDAVGKTVEWVAEAIRACAAELGTRLVVADYVQRFKSGRHQQDRRNQVSYVAETLSDAIKMSNCAGVLLSQLKRTDGKEPTMDDVKESGDLENMAEHVIIGWREISKGRFGSDDVVTRKAKIPKNKDGPILEQPFELSFNETTASFRTSREAQSARTQADRTAKGYDRFDDIADNYDERNP